MYCENDKFVIPERYLKMSPEELELEKERRLAQVQRERSKQPITRKTDSIKFKVFLSR